MVENIVVEFTSNTEGITTAEQAVQQLDKSTADQFTKTNASLKERQGLIDKNTAGLAQYAQKVQDAGKAAAGAFSAKGLQESAKGLKDLKDILGGTANAVKLLENSISNMKAKVQKEITPEEFKKLNAEIEKSEALLKELTGSASGSTGSPLKDLGDDAEKAGEKTLTLKAQLRAMKEELATIDDPRSPRFIQLSKEAGELQNKITDVNQAVKLLSSDTTKVGAAFAAVQGIAGAFAAAQGAIALFGNQNDELQQTLLRVNAAMSIMQGLQQVGSLLDHSSELNVFLINTLRAKQAATTTAVAVAEGEAAVATEALAGAEAGATEATVALNTAMSLNPAAILLLSLGTLVGLIEIFIGDTDKAAKAQEHLNNQLQEGIKTNDGFINEIKSSRDINKAQLEKSNASAAAIRQNDILGLHEQVKQTKAFEDSKYQIYVDADNKARALLAKSKRGSLSDNDKKELDAANAIVQSFSDLQRKRFDLEDQLQTTQISDEKATFDERLKNHTAFVDAQVLQTRAGSRAELVAQIDAIRAKEQEELQSQAHLPGEIAKIRAQASRDVQQKQLEIRVFDLNQEKLYADAKLQKSVEGSQQELNAKLNLMRIGANLEIAQAQGNSAKILDIKAAEKRSELDLIKTYNKKIQEDELNAKIATTNAEISKLTAAGADATNRELLEARKKLVEEQADVERVGVQFSIDTAENKAIRIEAINQKELADIRELEKQKVSAEITADETYFNAYYTLQADRGQRILNNDKISYSQRKQASKDFYDASIQLIENAHDADIDRLNNMEITQKEFDTRELQRLNQKEALKTQIVKEHEAERQAIQDKSFALASTFASGYFSMLSDQYNQDLAETQDLASKKLITQQEADKRTRDIKRKQAAADKEAALFNIAIQTAQNVIKDHLNPVLIGLDLSAFAVETAFVLAKKPPAFRYGETNIDGPGTSTSDSILARLSRGESVVTAAATQKWEPALQAMNAGTFEAWLANFKPVLPIEYPTMSMPQFEMPTMGTLPKWTEHPPQNISIDYDLLAAKVGKMVAKHVGRLEDLPSYEWNVDNDGLSQAMIYKNQRTQFLNNKYSFKRK